MEKEFFTLFEGLDRAHGHFEVTGRDPKTGKETGKAFLVREAATPAHWKKHLDGVYGLGIVPIRDDGTCRWGCLDIDDYTVDHGQLRRKIVALKLPLVMCRSKSGGAHLFLFMKEFSSADFVRRTLLDWAVLLGYPNIEIFPKQTQLASERDFGNWLNMPYFGGEQSLRYAYNLETGNNLTPREFLDTIPYQTEEELSELELPVDEMMLEAPPCLQTLAQAGFPQGTRNNGLFNIAVYLRKRYGDMDWSIHLSKYNERYMDPPLLPAELGNVEKSAGRKNYQYKCKDQPICQVCNKGVCLNREFGVGGMPEEINVELGPLVKINSEEPIYIWSLDGRRVELGLDTLMSQKKFQRLCVAKLDKWPNTIKETKWREMVNKFLGKVEIQEAPEEANMDGIALNILEKFCTAAARAREMDEVLIGLPWTENGYTLFQGSALRDAFENHHVYMKPNEIWALVRRIGGESLSTKVKGKTVRLWRIPEFKEESE